MEKCANSEKAEKRLRSKFELCQMNSGFGKGFKNATLNRKKQQQHKVKELHISVKKKKHNYCMISWNTKR